MTLSLAKAGIIVGGGLVVSLFVKEGQLSNVPEVFSAVFKAVYGQLSKGDPTAVKPKNDLLLQQVNVLRQELVSLKNRSMIVVTGSGSGSSKYGIIVIVVVGVGGYAWWKGWKLPSMMFATKRGLSEACDAVAKQLEDLYSSLRLSRRELASKIDSVSSQVKEVTEFTTDTNRKVNEISQEITGTSKDIQFVQETVYSLRTKIERIEEKQDATNMGVRHLVCVANDIKNERASSQAQALPPASPSGQALQRRQLVSSTLQHTMSLPPPEPSTCSNNSDEVSQQVPVTPSSTRRQNLNVYSEASLGARARGKPTNESRIQEVPTDEPSSSSTFGKLFSGIGGIMRTRSAVVTRSTVVKQGGLDGALN